MLTGTYIKEIELENDETVEIMRCPYCDGVLGIDVSFMDQVTDEIYCPMCYMTFKAANPPDESG